MNKIILAYQNKNKKAINIVLSIFIYLFINGLFVLKYSSRINFSYAPVITLIYLVLMYLVFFFIIKREIPLVSYKTVFYLIFLLYLFFTIWVNLNIDGNNLNVDRWSAMEVAIKALLNNEYPYSAVDHLNGRTSNLPSLILIGIPFYFLGDVGFLQSFSFAMYALLLLRFINNDKSKLIGLLLLILSPSFGWEIIVKSDLMSNFIIILFFIILVQKLFRSNMTSVIVTSIVASSLLLTRLVAIIPLVLVLFKRIFKLQIKYIAVFVVVGTITMLILLILAFKNYNSIDNFIEFNPFTLQNRQLPFILSLICIIIPFYYAFHVKNTMDLINYTIIFLSIPIFLSFIISTINNGVFNCVFNSYYDISYFNIILPFLIFQLTLSYDKIYNIKQL